MRDNAHVLTRTANLFSDLQLVNEAPHPWQRELTKMIREPADDRSVIWIFNKKGNVGKTKWAKWCLFEELSGIKAFILSNGTAQQLLASASNYAAAHGPPQVYIIDLPRTQCSKQSDSTWYQIIEALKSGIYCTSMYGSTTQAVSFSSHVVVFSNRLPNPYTLTQDRWRVYDIVTTISQNSLGITAYSAPKLSRMSQEEVIREYKQGIIDTAVRKHRQKLEVQLALGNPAERLSASAAGSQTAARPQFRRATPQSVASDAYASESEFIPLHQPSESPAVANVEGYLTSSLGESSLSEDDSDSDDLSCSDAATDALLCHETFSPAPVRRPADPVSVQLAK